MDIDDILEMHEFKSLDVHLDKTLLEYTSDSLYKKMVEVFGTHKNARNYFFSKIIALDFKRPYDLCRDGKQDMIYNELVNIEHGDLC